MAEWGGIARAVEEGLLDAESGGASSGGSLRGLAEALTGSNFAGFRIGDIFDKDRWSRRERVNQGRRLEETGIPDYTYDYVPTDRGVTTGLGPSDLTDVEMRDSRLGPHGGSSISARAGRPEETIDTAAQRQLAREYGHLYQQEYSDFPQTGLGITSTRVGRRGFDNPWDRSRNLDESKSIDPAILDKLRRDGGGPAPSGIQDRFGDRTFSPRRGRSPFAGRFSLGEARRARAMRNMTDEEQRNLSQRDREAVFEDENYLERMRAIVEARSNKRQGGQFLRNIHDSSGPTPPRTHPDWGAIEEDMAIRANRNRFEREYEGRDY